MSKRQFNSSGLSTDDRTILARVERILGPLDSRHGNQYHRIIWSIDDPDYHEIEKGYTDVVHQYRNYRHWKTWIESVERGSAWAVVVADDLSRSDDLICIDADHAPVEASELL